MHNSMRRYGGGLLLVLALQWTGSPAQATNPAAVGNCKIGCQQTLAQCEQKKGVRAHCPRRYQQCTQECESPTPLDRRSKKQKAAALCAQRCDLNSSTCEQANLGNAESCRAGRSTCIKRCE